LKIEFLHFFVKWLTEINGQQNWFLAPVIAFHDFPNELRLIQIVKIFAMSHMMDL